MIAKAPQTLNEFYWQSFVPTCRPNATAKTKATYADYLKRFSVAIGSIASPADLTAVNWKVLNAWLALKYPQKTQVKTLWVVRVVWSHANSLGICESPPPPAPRAVGTTSPKPPEGIKRPVKSKLIVRRRTRRGCDVPLVPPPRGPGETLLSYFASKYQLFRPLSCGSIEHVRRSLEQFAVWLGYEPRLSELTESDLSTWIKHLEQSLAPKTIYNHRGNVLGVWRDAAGAGAATMPGRVRAVKLPDPEPDSWGPAEIAAMVAAAGKLTGDLPFGVPRALYFQTLLRAAWETGLRRADLFSLRWEHISPDGVVQKRQAKTGRVVCGQLSVITVDLLRSIGSNPPLEWPLDISGIGYWLTRIKRLAGLPDTGQLQRVRRSSATNVALNNPGLETRFLGHTTTTADKHYIDRKRLPRLAAGPEPLPVADRMGGGVA